MDGMDAGYGIEERWKMKEMPRRGFKEGSDPGDQDIRPHTDHIANLAKMSFAPPEAHQQFQVSRIVRKEG
jgi:hypothetical protein